MRQTDMQDLSNRALTVRMARATLKDEILNGKAQLSDVLEDPPRFVRRMEIVDLLAAQRNWGIRRSRRLLADCGGIRENKWVQELTERQRKLIANKLRGDSDAGCV